MIQIDKDQLLTVLLRNQSVLGTSKIMPIVSSVRLTIKDDIAALTSTDQNNFNRNLLTIENPNKIEVDGCISCSLLVQFLQSNTKAKQVTLSVDNSRRSFKIKLGVTDIRVPYLPGSDFPKPMVSEQPTLQFNIKAHDLIDCLEKVRFAASDKPSQYHLKTVFISFTPNNIRTVSCDGLKMGIFSYPSEEITQGCDLLLPVDHVESIKKIFDQYAQDIIEVIVYESYLILKHPKENFYLHTRMLEAAKFIDYKKQLPTDFNSYTVFSFNKKEFEEFTTRALIFYQAEHSKILYTFTADGLKIYSYGMLGELNDEIKYSKEATNFNGEQVNTSFNPLYLLQSLKNFESEDFKFMIKDSKRGSFLVDDTIDVQNVNFNDGFYYLVMPIFIKEISKDGKDAS